MIQFDNLVQQVRRQVFESDLLFFQKPQYPDQTELGVHTLLPQTRYQMGFAGFKVVADFKQKFAQVTVKHVMLFLVLEQISLPSKQQEKNRFQLVFVRSHDRIEHGFKFQCIEGQF